MLNLLETEYKDHFKHIIFIAPTLTKNKTYLDREWIQTSKNVFFVNPKNELDATLKILHEMYSDLKDNEHVLVCH